MSRTHQSDDPWLSAAVDRFEGPLLRYASGLVGDWNTACDVVQDVFLRLCAADRARVEDGLPEWLFTVCRNRAMDYLRKEQRTASTAASGLRQGHPAGQQSSDGAERSETAGALRRAVEGLPPDEREVVRLRYQEGLTSGEIGRICGLAPGQVRYMIHVAIRRLRNEMA
jgi:RNA polymerase sigma factor (sigma-70 family)